jgi:general secretion pathway protein D
MGNPIGGKKQGDTAGLKQFEQGVEYEPRGGGYRVSFSLEDADLGEVIRVIGQLTGKRFIFGGNARAIKVTVFAPQKVTVAEAYQAFLSILDANNLTVIPSGRFFKIVEQKNLASMNTPIYGPGHAAPAEERTITRMHRLQNIAAQEAGDLLNTKFKSPNGDITVHAPTNMLIMTDTGANIRRMLRIVEEIDVGGASEQVWIEKINYGAASEAATRLNELFDIKGGAPAPAGAGGKPGASPGGGDSRISKVIADERTNSVIIVATERAYLRALEFIKVIDVPQTGEGEVHVRPLQYADATKLAAVLTGVSDSSAQGSGGRARGGQAQPGQAGGGVFEGGIKVVADEATNALIITSSLRDYAHMRQVIDQLDKPRRQVFIEAALMDLNVSRTDKFGIKFHGGIPDVPADGSLIAGGLDPLKSALALGPGAAESLQGFALGLRGPTIPGSEAIFGTAIPAVGVVLDMLASSGDSDLLATPHILATDNIEAKIHVGENKPQQTNAGLSGAIPGLPGGAASLGGLSALGGMAGGFGTGGMLQTGIKVSIKPSINESDEVRLQIKEEYSEPLAPEGTLGVRGSSQRTAETTLTVRDQQTVVIAGLVRSKNGRGQTKVPILGDIPLLGALFRSETKQLEKSNLLLVLTPHIIRSQDDLRRVFERKMQERQEFLDRYFVFSDSDYEAPKDYARTVGALEDVRKAYMAVEERKALDALLGAKAIKTHAPGRPLELPAPIRSQGGPGLSPETPPPASPGGLAPPPRVDGRPPIRNILKVEP